ncbi:leucine-rich repeat domain-containing protein [Rubripirellula lacrimiformis]|uniref:hypothetical protein n=1 Tax=Rubripirellula lacrimiformis TaxID=1930273 RepID=UPI00119E7823|nr:hypothetical protein [Rubripirellula lacrimiformis]
MDFGSLAPAPPTIGGWPVRYWVSYPPSSDTAAKVHRFSWAALAINLAAIAVVAGLLTIYVRRRNRGRVATPQRGIRISIADVLLATSLVAIGFALWQRLEGHAKQYQEKALTFSNMGAAYVAESWVPEIMADHIPQAVTARMRKFRFVRMEQPNSAQLQSIVDLDELQGLRIGGGDYDLKIFEQQVNNIHLVDLRLAGRPLDVRTFQAIAAIPRLTTLNLNRTNVTADVLQRLDPMMSLQRLSIMHTDVVADQLAAAMDGSFSGDPQPFARTLRELRLGHPMPGDSDQLKIIGWPHLASLTINELESQPNSNAMTIELAELPLLKTLALDSFQKYDLTLRDVPVLSNINEQTYQSIERLPRNASIPGALWFRRIQIDGAPQLQQLSFDARSIESFRYKDTPQLNKLGIAAYDRARQGSQPLKQLSSEATQAIIAGIGGGDGPALIDLDQVPLGDVDLSPLAENKGITELHMAGSGVTKDQWRKLAAMAQLTSFAVDSSDTDSADVKWILDSFPRLERLRLSPKTDTDSVMYFGMNAGMEIPSLSIIDRPHLKSLEIGDTMTAYLEEAKIIRLPSLAMDLRLGNVGHLELIDAPALRGFSLQGPLSANSTISGLRDLRFFGVGGPGVTDQTLAALESCQNIDQLTIAYPDVTADGLRSLRIRDTMTSLNLPGTPLDDSIVLTWPRLSVLTNLNLRDTKVTGKAIAHLCSNSALTRLVLDHSSVADTELDFLSSCLELKELSLRGVGISPQALDALLANNSLVSIDLEDATLTEAHFDAIIQSGRSLRWIGIGDNEIPEATLAQLMSRVPELSLNVEPTRYSTELAAKLISSGRIVDRDQWQMNQLQARWMQQAQAGRFFAASMMGGMSHAEELINIDAFAQLKEFAQQPAGRVSGNPAAILIPESPADPDRAVDDVLPDLRSDEPTEAPKSNLNPNETKS